MRDVQALFADYAAYHRTGGNKACHRIGIPLIMISSFGMLSRVHLLRASYSLDFLPGGGAFVLDAAIVLIVLAEIYYAIIEWRLAAAMLVVCALFYSLGAALPMWGNVTLFVLGWILQFVGHSLYEHRQPAFLRNALHLLVGPLWILNDLVPVVKLQQSV